jgi:hypothetical protein
MKANELMIGDWVTGIADDKLFPSKYVGKSIPCKVEGFSYEPIVQPSYTEKGIGIDLRPQIGLMVRVANNFGYMYFDAEKLSPIPLTPEILEKNGMHLYNRKTNRLMERCNHSDCFKEDENFTVELSLDNDGKIRWTINGDEYTIMPLDYVHQLQHALRLCGIKKEITL